jgi:hypothetical protein
MPGGTVQPGTWGATDVAAGFGFGLEVELGFGGTVLGFVEPATRLVVGRAVVVVLVGRLVGEVVEEVSGTLVLVGAAAGLPSPHAARASGRTSTTARQAAFEVVADRLPAAGYLEPQRPASGRLIGRSAGSRAAPTGLPSGSPAP